MIYYTNVELKLMAVCATDKKIKYFHFQSVEVLSVLFNPNQIQYKIKSIQSGVAQLRVTYTFFLIHT